MKSIYDTFYNNAEKQILNSNDKELFSETCEDHIHEKLKIETPYLDKTKTIVSISSEVIGFNNAPPNISFTPGQTMEFALFKVPIVGNLDLFASIASRQLHDSTNMYVEARTLFYKEISSEKISGNEIVIEEIKNHAKIVIESIQNSLEIFKQSADQFNENELKKHISDLTQRERNRRKTQSKSENKLNPFV